MGQEIRRVDVELLRRGPRHNQLLSPLTDYLAVCGEHQAGVVHIPYEQMDIQNLLEELRYEVGSAVTSDRLAITRERTGIQLARMLGSIPDLTGAITGNANDAGRLTHLRIVMSAAELALLPFEMTQLPVAGGGDGGGWLALQPDQPVCITRHVRGVSAPINSWPTKPKILFVAGPDVPFDEHLDAFCRVLEPWVLGGIRRDGVDRRRWTSEFLTVLQDATIDEIRNLVAEEQFTHVHVLAHGAEIEHRHAERYGVAFADRVVTGSEVALLLSSVGASPRSLPSVITLATCDSANQGSVVTPGGSVAHDLHAAGVPLVIASQFPISEAASISFAETFYRGELNGDHPLISICEVRRRLATQFPDEHAWASIVVYEALPMAFDVHLAELQYWQLRRGHEVALMRLEQVATSDGERSECLEQTGAPFAPNFKAPTAEDYERLAHSAVAAAERMPSNGIFAAESDGLRAAGFKRMAEVAYWMSRMPDISDDRQEELLGECFDDLHVALHIYESTMKSMLGYSDTNPQRKATIHWIVGQVLLMRTILGVAVDDDLWGIATMTARLDLDHHDEVVRAWGNVSLIELAVLSLAVPGRPSSIDATERAVGCAQEIVRLLGYDAEHIQTTRRQMRRYLTWWGNDRFVEAMRQLGVDRRMRWDEDGTVVAAARAVADVLTKPSSSRPRRFRTTAPTSDAQETAPSQAPPLAASPMAKSGVLEIELIPARNGDCLWMTYGDDTRHHVLIDCGSKDAADIAAERVLAQDAVELFVLTHIDADHISGAMPLFSNPAVVGRFRDIWFNGWKQLQTFLSITQGEEFSQFLEQRGQTFRWNGTDTSESRIPPIVSAGSSHPVIEMPGGMRLTVLSPTRDGLRRLAQNWNAALAEIHSPRAMLGQRARPVPPDPPEDLDVEALAKKAPKKDPSVPNLSSIAMLAEFGGRAALLTGDAHADVLAASIRSLQEARGQAGQRLRLDALKLSHHGSANATTVELLSTVACSNYLVSTDGSSNYYHPDREAIARVIRHGGDHPVLHFNYCTEFNQYWANPTLQDKNGYTAHYPAEGQSGLRVVL